MAGLVAPSYRSPSAFKVLANKIDSELMSIGAQKHGYGSVGCTWGRWPGPSHRWTQFSSSSSSSSAGFHNLGWNSTACGRRSSSAIGRRNSGSLEILAKVVRQRHKEIDESEKIMEDPYNGHVCDVMSVGVVSSNSDAIVQIKDSRRSSTVVWTMDMDIFQRYTGLPVVDGRGRCVGVFTLEDYVNRASSCRGEQWVAVDDKVGALVGLPADFLLGLPVSAIMSSPAIVIKEHAPIAYAAALMLQNQVHRLPVVGANGMLVGIVTRTDIFEPLSEINPMYHALAGRRKDRSKQQFTDG